MAPELVHVPVAGKTDTILLDGAATGGRHSIIHMHVRPGGGPALNRHDFAEMFSLFEGEVEMTCCVHRSTLSVGTTVTIPANAGPRTG